MRRIALMAALGLAACGTTTEPQYEPKEIVPGGEHLDRFVSRDLGLQLIFWDDARYSTHGLYTGARVRRGEWFPGDGDRVCVRTNPGAGRPATLDCRARLDGDRLIDPGAFAGSPATWTRDRRD